MRPPIWLILNIDITSQLRQKVETEKEIATKSKAKQD